MKIAKVGILLENGVKVVFLFKNVQKYSKMKEEAIVNGVFVIEKMDGKGGWHFVKLPKITKSNRPFGQVRVKGRIDTFEFKQYFLQPMGNGFYFLPIKAAIRKILKKRIEDSVEVILYLDESEVMIPDEILLCLADDPMAWSFFNTISANEQKYYIDWIYEAKQVITRDNRIVKMLERLSERKKMYDW